MRDQPLSGVRVLDLTRLLPGPFSTLILGDLGADVLKIEDPKGGDYIRWAPPYVKTLGAMYVGLNRNKRSIAIDLKAPQGREILLRLAAKADVLVESFRPGVMEKLGLGYPTLSETNPRLIYCAISGFGQNGPYRLRAGHDLNYIGIAGALGQSGHRGGVPQKPGFQLADIGGGSLYATVGILAALHGRERTGCGQMIDVSMTDGALSFLLPAFAKYFIDQKLPRRGEELLNGGVACYHVYQTKDGRYMGLAALEPKFWQAFCAAVGRPDLLSAQMAPTRADDPGFAAMTALFLERTRDEWESLFATVDACCEPVLELDEVLTHPQIAARDLFFDSVHPTEGPIREVRTPLSDPEVPYRPAPQLGEHTRTVLAEIGYGDDEIESLLKTNVVRSKG